MKGYKPFASVGFLMLCALMTACGGGAPKSGPPALIVMTTMLPNGVQGIAYNQVLAVSGGQSPYSWSLDTGHLPTGLMLTTGGEITGVVASNAATTTFTVKVTDAQTPVAAIARQSLTLTINPPLGIGTTTLPQGTVNLPYPQTTLMATGGLAPFSWSVVSGSLPTGMTLDSTSGIISGTPTMTGTTSFTVQANDADGETATAPLSITIVGLLQGSNTFYLNGFNNNQPFYVVGEFVGDGNGNITSGLLDENGTDSTGLLTNASIVSGVYSVIPSNDNGSMNNGSLGMLLLNINTPSGIVTRNYEMAFSQDGNVHLITIDANVFASGLLQKQSVAGLTGPSSLTGSYAYGFIGNDAAGGRYAGAGAFNTATPPDNGQEDSNDAGTLQSGVPTNVTFLTLDTTTGRGTMSIVVGSATRNYVFYVANNLSSGLVGVQIDPVSGTTGTDLALVVPQIGGSIGGGNAAFSNAALNAQVVLQLNAIYNNPADHMNYSDESIGVASFDAKGNISRSDSAPPYYLDENQGGNINSDGTALNQNCSGGTYSVAVNGRVTMSPTGCAGSPDLPPPTTVWYLTNNNRGFVIGADSEVTAGVFEPQSGGPFTLSSILPANLLGGTVTPVVATQVNELQSTAAFAGGAWTYSYVNNGPGGVVTTPMDINLGWAADSTFGMSNPLGKYTMGLAINNMPVTVQTSYVITAIPAMSTQTAQKMVVMDTKLPDGSAVRKIPRLIYLEH